MTKRSRKKLSPMTMSLLGGVCVGTSGHLFSGDWACSAIGFGFLAFLVTPLADWLVGRLLGGGVNHRWPSPAWGRRRQLVLLAVVTAAFTGWSWVAFRLARPELFEAALGVRPPAGVTALQVEKHYAGGPGDMVCLVRFHADRPTIDQLASHRPLTKGSEQLQLYLNGDLNWARFLEGEFGLSTKLSPSWLSFPPIARPEFYHWNSGQDQNQTVHLLWDPDTGEAHLLYSIG